MARGDVVCRVPVDKTKFDRLASVAVDLGTAEIDSFGLSDEAQEYANVVRDAINEALQVEQDPQRWCDLFNVVEQIYGDALVASTLPARKVLLEGAWYRYQNALEDVLGSGRSGLRLTGVLGAGVLMLGGMFFFLSHGEGR